MLTTVSFESGCPFRVSPGTNASILYVGLSADKTTGATVPSLKT